MFSGIKNLTSYVHKDKKFYYSFVPDRFEFIIPFEKYDINEDNEIENILENKYYSKNIKHSYESKKYNLSCLVSSEFHVIEDIIPTSFEGNEQSK